METNMFLKIKVAIVGVAASFTAAFGWLGWLILAWVFCMGLDWLTGSAAASKEGKWQSSVARAGIWHKCGMVVVVTVSALADAGLHLMLANIPSITLPFEYTVLICPIVVCWYIFTELGSIAENAYAMGAPVPSFLLKILAVAKTITEVAGGEDVTGNEE